MEISHDSVQPVALDQIAVLIPAWKPDERLVALVQALSKLPFGAIVVVNDGSGPEYERCFQLAGVVARTVVLRHSRNRGQGRAAKTALEYVLANLPHVTGIVTADADGQHAVADIVRVAEALSLSQGRPVLGTRIFGDGVPLRSRFGNVVTQYVFRGLSGTMIVDTQSGLRGIPRQWLGATNAGLNSPAGVAVDSPFGRRTFPFTLAFLFVPFAFSRRFRKRCARLSGRARMLIALLALAALGAISGCGGGGFFGQSSQSYSVTVTAVSGPTTHTSTVTLTVQ